MRKRKKNFKNTSSENSRRPTKNQMRYQKTANGYILRLIKGEKIIENLTNFCTEKEITSGFFSGIGAATQTTLGFYMLNSKEYIWKSFPDDHEIVSLNGNIAVADGKPFLHIHAVLADENFNAFGGHLKEASVGATCEINLTQIENNVKRVVDDEIGLKLLDL